MEEMSNIKYIKIEGIAAGRPRLPFFGKNGARCRQGDYPIYDIPGYLTRPGLPCACPVLPTSPAPRPLAPLAGLGAPCPALSLCFVSPAFLLRSMFILTLLIHFAMLGGTARRRAAQVSPAPCHALRIPAHDIMQPRCPTPRAWRIVLCSAPMT